MPRNERAIIRMNVIFAAPPCEVFVSTFFKRQCYTGLLCLSLLSVMQAGCGKNQPMSANIPRLMESAHVIKSSGKILGMSFSPGNDRLMFGTSNGIVEIWQLTNAPKKIDAIDVQMQISCIAIAKDWSRFCVGSFDGKITVWNLQTKSTNTISLEQSDPINVLAFSPDSLSLSAGTIGRAPSLYLLDAKRKSPLCSTHCGRNAIYGLSYSDSGAFLAVSGGDDTIRILNAQSLFVERKWVASESKVLEGITSIAYEKNASGRLISGDAEGRVCLWNKTNNTYERMFKAISGPISSIVLDSSGTFLAICGGELSTEEAWFTLFRLDTFEPVTTLAGHTGSINTLAMSNDGRILATGGRDADSSVRLWLCGEYLAKIGWLR